MNDPLDTALTRLRDMFAVAGFPEGGLLLHLRSGDFFALDAAGVSLWQCALTDGAAAETVSAASRVLNVAEADARVAIEGLARQGLALNAEPPASIPRFEDDGRRLSLWRAGDVVVEFDRSRLLLTAGPGLSNRSADDGDIEETLRIFVPKILGAWFPLTLHASAIERNGKASLFSGDSGAGKTTTARLAADELAGARLLAEDVSLLAIVADHPFLVEGAEAAIHPWMNEAAATLAKGDGASVDVEPLRRGLDDCPGRVSLHRITFLDRARREGALWRLAPLSPARALQRLFVQSFHHSAATAILRQQLASLRQLAAKVDAREAKAIPEGLAAVRRAIRDQSETIAS